jgi:hypothetical protein
VDIKAVFAKPECIVPCSIETLLSNSSLKHYNSLQITAAGRLAEARQLEPLTSAPIKRRNQKGDSMSSKDQQGRDQRANQTIDQHPIATFQHAVEPSGPKGDNPATAGPGPTKAKSGTPENRLGHINPSAPENANTTPGTTDEK